MWTFPHQFITPFEYLRKSLRGRAGWACRIFPAGAPGPFIMLTTHPESGLSQPNPGHPDTSAPINPPLKLFVSPQTFLVLSYLHVSSPHFLCAIQSAFNYIYLPTFSSSNPCPSSKPGHILSPQSWPGPLSLSLFWPRCLANKGDPSVLDLLFLLLTFFLLCTYFLTSFSFSPNWIISFWRPGATCQTGA